MPTPYITTSVVARAVPFDNTTNGFVATNAQDAIEEARLPVNTEVSATADTTTTSGTDALMNSMTLTPGAGTFLLFFNNSITSNNAGAAISTSVYIAGVQSAKTLRKIIPFDGGTLSATTGRGVMCIISEITVAAGQAVEIRWSTSGGTATSGPRTLNLLKVT